MDSKQWNVIALALVVALVGVAVWLFYPPQTRIRQGLDIKGGLDVILTAEGKVDATTIDRAITIVQNRVDGLGVSGATVQKEGANALRVQLPGVKDARQALKMLGSTGQLEFVEVASLPATTQAAVRSAQTTGKKVRLQKGTYEPVLTGEVIESAQAGANTDADAAGTYEVNMIFNPKGTEAWAAITARSIGKPIAIVLDGQVVSAPNVQGAIPDGQSVITGSFTAEEAKQLATILQTGALPVSLKYSDTNIVGPILGQASLRQGMLAAIVGVLIVAAYLTVYYRGLGVIAWFSLGIFLILYLGLLAGLSMAGVFALDLPGIAGIVLAMGLAADTSILIFERFREEIAMGKSPRSAARSGTKHALLTSVDADVVTVVSAAVISSVALGPVRGFANTLMMGIALDLIVGFLFTRTVIIMLAESVVPKARAFFGLKAGEVRG